MRSNATIVPSFGFGGLPVTTLSPIPPSDTFRCGNVILGLASMVCLLQVIRIAHDDADYSQSTGHARVGAWMCADLVILGLNLMTGDLPSNYRQVDPPWPESRSVYVAVNASWGCDQPQVLVVQTAGLDLISWASGVFLLLHVWAYWFFLGLSGAHVPGPLCGGRRAYPVAGLLCLVAMLLHFIVGPRYALLSYRAHDPGDGPCVPFHI